MQVPDLAKNLTSNPASAYPCFVPFLGNYLFLSLMPFSHINHIS